MSATGLRILSETQSFNPKNARGVNLPRSRSPTLATDNFLSVAPLTIDRSLTVQNSVAVDQLPNGHVLDPEASSGFCNPQSTVPGGESMALNEIQETLALFAVGFFGGQPRSKRSQFVPGVFKTGLSRLVAIDEDRIRVRVMRQHTIGCLLIEPVRCVLIVQFGRNQWPADQSKIAAREQIKKSGINRQAHGF